MEIYFHVGLPRAASTFFQYNVFPHFKGVQYIKKHSFNKRENIISRTKPEKILLSTEMDIGKENKFEKLKLIAKEYPEARAILVLRKHSSWVKSKYFYFIRKHGSLDFHEFFNFENSGFFKIEHLEYKRKIELIEGLYSHKPYVIFQEDIADDPYLVIKKLSAFMGVEYDINKIRLSKVNKSFSQTELRRLLYLNKKLKNWPEKVKMFNLVYRAFRNLLIRLVVIYSKLTPEKSPYLESLIPGEAIARIDNYFENDWNYCKQYAEENYAI